MISTTEIPPLALPSEGGGAMSPGVTYGPFQDAQGQWHMGFTDNAGTHTDTFSNAQYDGRGNYIGQAPAGGRNTFGAPPGGGGAPTPPGVAPAATKGVSAFLKAIAPTVIGQGLNLAGAVYQNKQNQKAADAQAQATKDALAQQWAQWNADRTDSITFRDRQYADQVAAQERQYGDRAYLRGLGQNASAGLGYFVGVPGYEQGNKGILPPGSQRTSPAPVIPPYNPAPPVTPPLPGSGSNSSTATNTAGMVWMTAPDGSRKQVPQNQVTYYQGRGAVLA